MNMSVSQSILRVLSKPWGLASEKIFCTQNFELNFKEWALETFKRWSWEHPGNLLYTLVLIGLFHLRSLLVFLIALTKFAQYKCAFLCASSFVSVSTLKCRLPRSRDWAGFCWALFPTAWHGAIALSTLFECLPDLDPYYHFVNQTSERKCAWNKFSQLVGSWAVTDQVSCLPSQGSPITPHSPEPYADSQAALPLPVCKPQQAPTRP